MIVKGLAYLRGNALGALALFVALGGTSYAATGGFTGSGGQLRACVNESGSLTLLKSGKHCRKGQKAVAWDMTGPAGPAGATGATGATGAAGSPGSKGADGQKGADGESLFANVVVREKSAKASGYIQVQCEPGEIAVGGGGSGNTNSSHLYGTGPLSEEGNAPTGWFAQVEAGGGEAIKVYAVCAS